MRTIFTLCIALLISLTTSATLYTVTVSSNQFTPNNLNVQVGDQVRFVWSSGFHTSTCDPNALPGTYFPTGATGWDNTMSGPSSNFTVTISVAGTYLYGCQPHWPSMQGTINASTGTMPVTLGNFSVTNVNNQARLNWRTVTEQNSDYFSVKRSTDGQNFTEVKKVRAAGNSTSEISYSYTDNTINKKDKYIYYALGIVDKDGKVKLSPIQMFKNPNATSKLIMSLSPNPISKPGHLMIRFNADRQTTLFASLVNPEGKIILQTEMDAFAGLNNGHFHLGSVAAGTYTIVFKLDDIIESHKVVVK